MEDIEKYVNNETIIKDSIYDTFKEFIICPNCKKLIIGPVMCLTCGTKFCNKCKDNADSLCKCKNPQYQNIKEEKKMISKFKFKCIKGCGEEIPYNEIKNHYISDCAKKTKFLRKNEVAKLGKEVQYLKSKNIFYLILIVITLGDADVGKTSLINT